MDPPTNINFQFDNNRDHSFPIPTPVDLDGNKITKKDLVDGQDIETPVNYSLETPGTTSTNPFPTPTTTNGTNRTPLLQELITPIQDVLTRSPANLLFNFPTPVSNAYLTEGIGVVVDDDDVDVDETDLIKGTSTSPKISVQMTDNKIKELSRQTQEFRHHKATNQFAKRNPLKGDKTQYVESSQQGFLSVDPQNYTVVSPQNFTVVSNKIELIEGFNTPVIQKVPGGKGNTKDCIPRQVVELKYEQFQNVNPTTLLCSCEVLGFDRKQNGMVPLGQVMAKPFIQTTDKRYLAVFDHCVVKYSSHLNGQKLALRFTLVDRTTKQPICYVDSKSFQTITQRGKEKQAKRKRKKTPLDEELLEHEQPIKRAISTEPWTSQEISNLLKGTQTYGEEWEQILQNLSFRPSRTAQHLKLKFEQLLSP